MEKISKSVVKRDHSSKISGKAIYVGDYEEDDILIGKMLRSTKAKAKIIDVKIPKLLDGYCYVDKTDVPGDNKVNIVKDDTPVYATDTVEYIGEPIGMVCGPNEEIVNKILSEIEVIYEELEPVINIRDFDTVFFDYSFGKGDVEKAFSEADKIYEEEFETGYQDQTYLETQGLMAEIMDGEKVYVHGSMQCPYYVKGAVMRAMNLGPDKVRIAQDATGGGFGGKEAFPSILACQVAVAAKKAGKKVRCIFDRREDLEFTSKRHPSLNTYKVAVKDGKVTAMDIDVKFNGGAYTTLSAVVLQRGIICANGIYNIQNLKVRGRAVKTNTTPSGAYRGFGAPQTFFSAEVMMNHIAKDLGKDSLEFKEMHLVKQGDSTSTSGKYHFPVPIPNMIERIDKACDFRRKHREYSNDQNGRYRKGIGISMYFHGAGFTGSGERDIIKAVAKLHKYSDGRVQILASNTDIGQGLRTTFPKIVAKELNIPLEKVFYEYPDTDVVPDSGPTVASRSLMTVGELLRRAAIKLRGQWVEGEEQIIEEHYKEPDFMIPFYIDKFQGDAYPTYSWAVNAIEVEVDTYTGLAKILGAYGCFDIGTPMDYNIAVGQMEGGFLQGIGYASTEYMVADAKGRIRNNSFSDYIIPTAVDVPNLKVDMYVDEKYPYGPYGAKGAGELPLVGAPGAYAEAIEQALGHGAKVNHAPFTAEDTIKVLSEERE
ncbi:xanthine dehydrogenase family protein [Clostridium botulinum]|nr:xanthine dehydrogenase family protein [Clostridium botulinum]